MDGYVRNTNNGWIHIFKQDLGPNGTLSLDKLYETYGKKNGLSEGDEFIDWLKNVKLKNREGCKLEYDPLTVEKSPKEEGASESKPGNTGGEDGAGNVSEVVPSSEKKVIEDEVTAITSMSVIKAKEKLPKISNLPLLKDAFRQAKQMPNKDTLCLMIDKRIRELSQFY